MVDRPLVPPLGADDQDTKTALLKAALGGVPIAGPVLAELVGFVVPRQRQDRFEQYLRLLAERLTTVEEQVVRGIGEDSKATDLFEEGAIQSARAISDERQSYIASIVANGLAGDQHEKIIAKRLLGLLGELDDDQIIILVSYLRRHRDDKDFRGRHQNVLAPIRTSIGSSQEELDRAAVRELAYAQLDRLGLLKTSYATAKNGEVPEFDQHTGTLKARARDLSPLGRLLLARMGLAQPGEF